MAGGGAANYLGSAFTNRVIADFGTVGGGLQNSSGGFAATVGGGYLNTSSGDKVTVGGGQQNTSGNSNIRLKPSPDFCASRAATQKAISR